MRSKYNIKPKQFKPIAYILADSNYSIFHYTDGTNEMFATTLGKLEDKGIRIHKSVIINPEHIDQIIMRVPVCLVRMKDRSIHPISRRRVKYFIDCIEDLKR